MNNNKVFAFLLSDALLQKYKMYPSLPATTDGVPHSCGWQTSEMVLIRMSLQKLVKMAVQEKFSRKCFKHVPRIIFEPE